jgi:3-deoxy-D-manno-octulosonic-acid transferase
MSRLTALAYAIVYCLALPFIVLKLLRAPGDVLLRQRFGIDLPAATTGAIWLHASSVGEVALLEPVVAGLEQDYPDTPLLITAFTATGIASARQRFARHAVCAMPFDLRVIIRRYIRRFTPSLVIVFESEFWPGFLSAMRAAGTPVVIFNAKISERSVRAHSRTRFVAQALREVALIAAQDETNADRFKALDVSSSRIEVTGNMKFDLVSPAEGDLTRASIGIDDDATVIVGGSLHDGEADIILDAVFKPDRIVQSAVLLIAPRYIETAREIMGLATRRGLKAVLRSSLRAASAGDSQFDVCIVDTLGELRSLYAIADAVFVGGSLFDRGSNRGGHNLMEPAICGIPVLFGPFNSSFAQVARDLVSQGGGMLVRTSGELRQALGTICGNAEKVAHMGAAARDVVLAGRGATARNLALIRRLLERGRH